MNWLVPKIRPIMYSAGAVLALGLYLYAGATFPTADLQKIRLVQWYAFLSAGLLYLALLASPLYVAFPSLPGKVLYTKARKAIGVTAFFFGALHGVLAFFGTLGGFSGLGFLSKKFIIGISLSSFALLLLTIMAITSVTWLVKRFKIPWKLIHRIVYVAGALIFVHALMLGTHYIDLRSTVAVVSILLVAFLLVLEMHRLDSYFERTMPPWPRFGAVTLIGIVAVSVFGYRVYGPTGSTTSFGIHAGHLSSGQTQPSGSAQKSSAKRYTASINPQRISKADYYIPLSIMVFDADTGQQVFEFEKTHEQLMHVVIVDSTLGYFEHVHPTLENGVFSVEANFPNDAFYRAYLQFMPKGDIEQTIALTLPVGKNPVQVLPAQTVDSGDQKQTLSELVTMRPTTGSAYSISDLRSGKQAIMFSIKDSIDGTPITNIEPYLGAFGHLVMIKQDTYQYVHVHPKGSLVSPNFGGPEVEFSPLAFTNFEPLVPGLYRAFAQFKRGGNVFTVDFTLELKP